MKTLKDLADFVKENKKFTQIIGYKNIEKNLKTDTEKVLSIDFFFRDTILNENVKDN